MSEEFATKAGTTVAQFRAWDSSHSEAAVPDVKAQSILRMASNAVAGIAPPPETEDQDYWSARKDAELWVANHALRTGWGELARREAGTVARAFNKDYDVLQIVRQTMPSYVVEDSSEGGASSMVYVSRL